MKERIRKIRKNFDLTQQEFAGRLGVKRGAIANYEIGRNEPVDSIISLICREFNVREEWLRSGNGEMFKAAPSSALEALSEEYGLSDAACIMIEKFVNLKPEAQETIFSYVREVAAAFQSGETPSGTLVVSDQSPDLTIDPKVEFYRREPEREDRHDVRRIGKS